jgi:hypothetical protein
MQKENKYDFDFVMNELKSKSIHDKYPYSHTIKTKDKVINMSLGRIFLNQCLPEDFPLLNEPINQSKLNWLVKELIDKYEPMIAADTIANIQNKFYQISTISPSTFVVDSFLPSNTWVAKKKEFEKVAVNYNPAEFQTKAAELTTELVKEIEEKGYRIHNILKGGIKGNPIDDWKNLLVGKGYLLDIEGNLMGPIVHGISEGLTKQEYFDGIAEARRGFYYKASLTAIPGYLARKLTMASANITLTDEDCGSKTYLEIFVDKNNIKTLTGRFMLEKSKLIETTSENLAPYIGKKIKIRSPLYCMSKKNQICPVCFGTLAKKVNTDRIGIMAAGVVNLITINELMKMRHKSSQISAQEVDFLKIIKESSVDNFTINKLLNIEKNKITAKVPISIEINQSEYNENELIETESYYEIPGLLNVMSDEDSNISVELPFEFAIKLYKPSDILEIRNTLEFRYTSGELVISKDYITDQTDPQVIRRLFDAGFKYLKSPEMLVNAISKRLPGIDLTYIETIVQNMYRSKTNPQNNARLTHYKDYVVYSQKQLPHFNSWINSLSFENIDKGIKNGLLTNRDIRYDPIEKIVIEKFN